MLVRVPPNLLAAVRLAWLFCQRRWRNLIESGWWGLLIRNLWKVLSFIPLMIDDYSMSSVNATVGTLSRLQLTTLMLSSMLAELMRELSRCGKRTHLLARSFDLSAAYRQLCVAPSSFTFSHICVYDPVSGVPRVFRQVCLTFGSRSVVDAFIRCAKCIQWLAAKCLSLPTI